MMSAATAGLIFQGLGILALLWFLFTLVRLWGVRAWPRVSGTILASHVERDADRNAFPVVRYRYSVHGVDHEGDRILAHGVLATTSGASAQRTVDRYRTGRTVAVYVNPSDPSDAILERRVPVVAVLMQLAAAVAFWTMGAAFRAGLLT